jgi:hypothetical protein
MTGYAELLLGEGEGGGWEERERGSEGGGGEGGREGGREGKMGGRKEGREGGREAGREKLDSPVLGQPGARGFERKKGPQKPKESKTKANERKESSYKSKRKERIIILRPYTKKRRGEKKPPKTHPPLLFPPSNK